jgi:hypothetical protein
MDITQLSVAKSLIDEIESNQFEERRQEEYKAYKVAEGGQRSYVLDRLQALFPESWNTMRVSDISVSNKVLTKVSKAYKESPIRLLDGQTDDVNELFDKADFDTTMAEFDRDLNRQRYGLLWVNKIEDQASFHSLKGFESFVKVNKQSGVLEVVVINYPDTNITATSNSDTNYAEETLAESQDDTSAESRVYAMWTKDSHAIYRITEKKLPNSQISRNIEQMEIPGNVDMRNDLGVIPFVYHSRSSSVDLPFLNQLTEQSITYNILNSDMLTASALQGYGQLVVTMPEDMEMETMNGGMTTVMQLPIVQGVESQADAKYINPGADLPGMKMTIDSYAADILSEHGINGGQSSNTEGFSSGLERLIANADVSDQITANQRTYSKIEREAIDILRKYGLLKEGDAELVTIFPKAKVMISDKETLENIKMRLDLGLITKVEALQIIDPNMSPEDAQDKVDEIKESNKLNVNDFIGGNDGSTGQENPESGPFPDTKK